jgi:hypothetical protein
VLTLDRLINPPRMLYAHVGMKSPEEPYDIDLDPKHRDIVKKALNAFVIRKNARDDTCALGRCC